jgi:ABC-type spermidine/putrescine transport system permease subunit I
VGAVQGGVSSAPAALRSAGRHALLALPLLIVGLFLLVPIGLTFAISFWERAGVRMRAAFTLGSYAEFFAGARLVILERSLVVAIEVTLVSLLVAYPIAYFLAMRATRRQTRLVLFLFTIPFVINYIIRTFSWSYLLGRNGPINHALMWSGITHGPLDWLLFSDFAVLIGLVTSYMPFMIFPLWLSLVAVERQLIETSWLLGAGPVRTFGRVTFPLSVPGVFAAVIFCFVGAFGDSAVPIILGGTGYQLMGNTVTSALDVLNYPLAAAMSSVVILVMLALLLAWYALFDMRAFLGKMLRWRY